MSDRRDAGLSLVEVVASAAILAVTILGASLAASMAMREITEAREVQAARLASQRAIEALTTVRFRPANASDAAEALFRGTYEIARNPTGTSYLMPDVRTVATTTDNRGIGGAVVVDFPVPGLQPLAGRTFAGRLYLYVNETLITTPTANFPFPAMTTPTALTKLDLDGDAAPFTTNIRVKYTDQPQPYRFVPVKVVVEWREQGKSAETYEEFALLAFQGY